MKIKRPSRSAAAGLASALALFASAPSVHADPAADKAMFDQAAQELDSGGSYYYYANVEGMLRDGLASLNEVLAEQPEAAVIMIQAEGVLEELDLFGVEAFGKSLIDRGDFQRSKCLLMNPGERKGAFKLIGGAPHASAALAYAPADAAFFASQDLDPAEGIKLARRLAERVGGAEAVADMAMGMAETSQAIGVDVNKLAEASRGEFAVVATLEQDNMVMLPADGAMIEAPEPRFALLIPASQPLLIKTIRGAGPLEFVRGADGVERGQPAMPLPPGPFPISPRIAWDGHYLILASNADLLDEMLAASRGEVPGLASSEEYQTISEGLPAEGNGWMFVSSEVWTTAHGLIERSLEAEGTPEAEAGAILAVARAFLPESASACVLANREGGVLVAHQGQISRMSNFLGMNSVATAGVLAAIAVPNFLQARARAEDMRVESDLRSIQMANDMYAVDHGLEEGDPLPSFETLVEEGYLMEAPSPPSGHYEQGEAYSPNPYEPSGRPRHIDW